MQCDLLWAVPPVAAGTSCTCIAIAADGFHLAAGVASTVQLHDAKSGRHLRTLHSHKAAVCSISWSCDGQQIAGGTADGTILVWSVETGGVLVSYAHEGPVATVAFSPTAQRLASASAGELALWSCDAQTIFKDTVPAAHMLCLAWSSDGSQLALGQADGGIALRSAEGVPLGLISSMAGIPVTSLAWSPSRDGKPAQRLAACGGNGTLALVRTTSSRCKQLRLGFAPRSISNLSRGDMILMCGSNGSVQLYSRDGIALGALAAHPAGMAALAASADGAAFAVACEDGSIRMHGLRSELVHSTYGQRFAYRALPTDIVVQHLHTGERVKVCCRMQVLQLALHRRCMAVGLPQQVAVYELPAGARDSDMAFRLTASIPCDSNSRCLVVLLGDSVAICQGTTIKLYGLNSVQLQQWQLVRPAVHIATLAMPGRPAALLVAQHGGQVLQIDTADSASPALLLTEGTNIMCAL